MREHWEFLCDIYQYDDLIHEAVQITQLVPDRQDLKEFWEKRRFREAAAEAVEEKCLEKIERDYEGGTDEFKVIVTESNTNEKRVVVVEAEPEVVVKFNFNVIEEKEYKNEQT